MESAAGQPIGIPWAEARGALYRNLRRRLPRADPADLDDLTQEAIVRVLRAVRVQAPRSLPALLQAVAHRVAIDHIRKRARWIRRVRPLVEEDLDCPAHATSPAVSLGDPLERLRFLVLEFFAERSRECYGLALAFFSECSWPAVAEGLGCSHAAVRKQWSRCLERLRRAARERPGPLTAWADEFAEE